MRIEVFGTPAPQGSKRHVGNGVMVESSKKVKPWRQDVKFAALEEINRSADPRPLAGAVVVAILFYLTRPKGHHGTGRNADTIKASSPRWPASKPDLDKLIRSTLDALTEAGAWGDDAQVIHLEVSKYYADFRAPGAVINVSSAR